MTWCNMFSQVTLVIKGKTAGLCQWIYKLSHNLLKICTLLIWHSTFSLKTMREKNTGLYMEINGGDNNRVFHHDLWGDNFGVKPYELSMDINGGDKNRVFLHDLIKITEGTVSEGTIFISFLRSSEILQK